MEEHFAAGRSDADDIEVKLFELVGSTEIDVLFRSKDLSILIVQCVYFGRRDGC